MALEWLDPVTTGARFAGAALKIGARWHHAIDERERTKIKEQYRQELQDIQHYALEASFARHMRASALSESIALGRQATALSKNRIGVAGTAVGSFNSVFEHYDRLREGKELEITEQLGKLATYRHSSERAENQPLDYFGLGLASMAEMVNVVANMDMSAFGSGQKSSGNSIPQGIPTIGVDGGMEF